jgi:hypothetical protein
MTETKPTTAEVPEIFMLAVRYAKKVRLGLALALEPGIWKSDIDSEWSLEFNGHNEPMFSERMNRMIPPRTVYFFSNGLQAAAASLFEAKGADADDDGVSERFLIIALKNAIAGNKPQPEWPKDASERQSNLIV